ncbi:hypothetical protein E4U41_005103 [Claviceps citrina]|nr:hypothetical protein E4U41_005103 [Claviceps citrina]
MESMSMSQHDDSYFPEESLEDYSFWQVDPWFNHTQARSPHPAFPLPLKSECGLYPAQEAIQWMYMNNPETPMFTSPATEEAPALFPMTVPDEPKPANSLKRRRSVKLSFVKAELLDQPSMKRARTRRSKSSTCSDKSSADDSSSRDKDDVYQERSRMASNKFRARKRNEIAQLESEEYSIEDANRNLRSVLDSLTSEILALKMQILQHTHCNCELIQEYINKEAVNFVQNLETVGS